MPLFVWLMVVTSGLTLITITPLTAAQVMLIIDRYLGGHFFDAQAGGARNVWMHFFWIFGHPEVYVLILPAFGIASEVIPVFSRKAIFGYPAMVAASVGIAFVSLTVWAHHMFTVGMTSVGNTFFALSTMMVGISHRHQDIQLDCDHVGRQKSASLRRCCSARRFYFSSCCAGLTGIMLASRPGTGSCTTPTS